MQPWMMRGSTCRPRMLGCIRSRFTVMLSDSVAFSWIRVMMRSCVLGPPRLLGTPSRPSPTTVCHGNSTPPRSRSRSPAAPPARSRALRGGAQEPGGVSLATQSTARRRSARAAPFAGLPVIAGRDHLSRLGAHVERVRAEGAAFIKSEEECRTLRLYRRGTSFSALGGCCLSLHGWWR
jgi:hypothetical protein